MKRRQFVFRSAQAALLLGPLFDLRRAAAQLAPSEIIPFFFVDGGSPYPTAADFFPNAGVGGNFNLPPILQPFELLKNDLVVLDGVNLTTAGPNIRNNRHVDSVGKVLTAKRVRQIPGAEDGEPTGPSIDHLIATALNRRSVEVLVNNRPYNHMRARPFASGDGRFKLPTYSAAQVFDNLFRDCQSIQDNSPEAKLARLNKLKAEQSIMDSLTGELGRLRKELVGIEKVKMDSHEDAIREAERGIALEMKAEEEGRPPGIDCNPNLNLTGTSVPQKSQAHFDVLYASIKAKRAGVYGMMHGYSSVQWACEWLDVTIDTNSHNAIFHSPGSERADFIKIAQWKWGELAKFALKLKNEPGGSLLDQVLIYATSHFGLHHTIRRTPVVLLGNAGGKLTTGRSLKVNTDNDKPLTSVARLCGVNLPGIGENTNCGPLAELAS